MFAHTSTSGRFALVAARIARPVVQDEPASAEPVSQTAAEGPGTAGALFSAAVALTRTGLVLAWALMVVALANAWTLWPAVAFPMAGAFAAAGALALVGRRRLAKGAESDRAAVPLTHGLSVAAGGDTSWAELMIGTGL